MRGVYLLEIICIVLFLSGILLGLFRKKQMRKNKNVPHNQRKKGSYAILIPAREEAKVIRGILESLKNQTRKVNMSDVYVIIEREDDPTYFICKEYNTSIFIRTKLENRRRKGYALDECLQSILAEKRYDAYFIFDADNILADDYLERLEQAYLKGYDLGFGYRNCKNGNDSLIAACSALTFSMINTLENQKKVKNTNNLTITGTGFFVAGEWIEKWHGYPFHSLTEDYELSLYATCHDLTTAYVEEAVFFDEQPRYYQDTIHQRVRWIKGYFTVRKMYRSKLWKRISKRGKNYGSQMGEVIGILPILLVVLSASFYFLLKVGFLCLAMVTGKISILVSFLQLCGFIGILYFVLMGITAILLLREKGKLNLTRRMQRRVCCFNPIYLLTYIPCAIQALFKKEVLWKVVSHEKTEIS